MSPAFDAAAIEAERTRRQPGITWAIYRDRLPSARAVPAGWKLVQEGADGRAYRSIAGGHATVIESVGREADGQVWHHVSLGRKDRRPTWDELAAVKEAFVGNRYAYIVFPPRARYVNLHPNVLHVFSCLEGPEGRRLPEFSVGGSV